MPYPVNFVINPLPTITGNSGPICIGGTLPLTGSATPAASNAWLSATPSVATVNVSTGVVTGVANGTSVITYTNNNGCQITTTVTVIQPVITGGPNVCPGGTITLTGSGTPHPTTPWSSSNDAIATISNAGVVTGVTPGTVTITFTNSIGCTRTASITVLPVVNPGTVANANESICYNGDASDIGFSTAPSGGAGTFTYQWYYQIGLVACPTGTSTAGWTLATGSTADDALYTQADNLTGSRTYAVFVNPTGTPDCGTGSWASGCRQITVLPAVNYGVVASGDQSFCPGGDPDPISLSAAPSGGSGTFTYQWYYDDGIQNCPTGGTGGWTSVGAANGGQTTTYDPPAGLIGSKNICTPGRTNRYTRLRQCCLGYVVP